MKSGREGMVVGYNAQNAVDEAHQLIVHHELTPAGNDNQLPAGALVLPAASTAWVF